MAIIRRAEQFLDLPSGAFGNEALVEIVGNRQVSVDGACDIQEYDPSCVRLKTKQGSICIRGDGLYMDSLHAGGICVLGCIATVEFS